MKNNGALMPHQGVFVYENSTGVHVSFLGDTYYSIRCQKENFMYTDKENDDTPLVNTKLLRQLYKWINTKTIINSNVNNTQVYTNILINDACNSRENQLTIHLVAPKSQDLIQIDCKINKQFRQNNDQYQILETTTIAEQEEVMIAKAKRLEKYSPIHQQCTIYSGQFNWRIILLVQFYLKFLFHLIFSQRKNGKSNDNDHIDAIMRAAQSYSKRFKMTFLLFTLLTIVSAWPQHVLADEEEIGVTLNGITVVTEVTSTTEFDYATRGDKKFGDRCENTMECGFPGSTCDAKKKSCQCVEDLPVTNHIDKCGKEAAVNESCFFNEQCEAKYFQTECRDGRCVCRFEMSPILLKDGTIECKGRQENKAPEVYVDWAMIGVLIGMALMFIIICVVLRLFSQARWHENRTIFNTPNPRLMNVSLLRESKLLHAQERRGSRISVRGPSRQPSMTSLRPHSPNPSLGKTGSRSNSNSNASATSIRSNSVAPGLSVNNGHHERKGSTFHAHHHPRSQIQSQQMSPPPSSQHHQHHHHHQQQQHHQQQEQQLQEQPLITNITSNPVAENVTVEILDPKK